MAILSDFSALHRHIQFELPPDSRVLDLMAGEADFALRLTWAAPNPRLVGRKISTVRFTLFGGRSYAEKHGLPAAPSEMRGHVFVALKRDARISRNYDWLIRHVPPEQVIMTFCQPDLVKVAILSGHGLGVMNLNMVAGEEAAGSLIRCFEPPEEMSMEHLMLIAPDAWRRPEVKEFTRFFAPRYAAIFK